MPIRAAHAVGSAAIWRYPWRTSLSLARGRRRWSAPATGTAEAIVAVVAVRRPAARRCCRSCSIRWRRRWPVRRRLLTALLASSRASSAGRCPWSISSLASRPRWRRIGGRLVRYRARRDRAAIWSPTPGRPDLRGSRRCPRRPLVGVVVAIGYVRRRPPRAASPLRERAPSGPSASRARVAQARAHERTRIAREMHDVLAHRISLVAMHAGALGVPRRPDRRGDAARPPRSSRTAPTRRSDGAPRDPRRAPRHRRAADGAARPSAADPARPRRRWSPTSAAAGARSRSRPARRRRPGPAVGRTRTGSSRRA